MRKLTYSLTAIVVLAAIILIPPFFIGKVTQKRLENNVSLLNENQSVHVVVNHYQRHWFSSTANVEVPRWPVAKAGHTKVHAQRRCVEVTVMRINPY